VSGEKCHCHMADTYGCPLKNLPNQKHKCLQTYNFLPYKTKTKTANGHSCWAS